MLIKDNNVLQLGDDMPQHGIPRKDYLQQGFSVVKDLPNVGEYFVGPGFGFTLAMRFRLSDDIPVSGAELLKMGSLTDSLLQMQWSFETGRLSDGEATEIERQLCFQVRTDPDNGSFTKICSYNLEMERDY